MGRQERGLIQRSQHSESAEIEDLYDENFFLGLELGKLKVSEDFSESLINKLQAEIEGMYDENQMISAATRIADDMAIERINYQLTVLVDWGVAHGADPLDLIPFLCPRLAEGVRRINLSRAARSP